MAENSAKFTEGSIGKSIFYRTLPMTIGMIGILSFNLIDTYFIGRISEIGTEAQAALGFTFPVTYIVTALAMGIGTGASAIVSREIGKGDSEKTVRYASDSLTLGLIFVMMFLILGLLTIRPLFSLIGAEGLTLDLVDDYMSIWYLGTIFVIIPMIGNSLLRAKGDMKTPSFVMLVAVILNTILDPLLIFGMGPFPELGIKGAAIATVISRAITLFVSLHFLYRRDKILSFKIPLMKDVKESYKKILYIGLPSAGTSLVMPLGILIILRIVSVYGAPAVAGFGVAGRIEGLALTVIMALGSVLGPFIGQNIGAQKIDRVFNGVRFSQIFGMIWGAIMMVVLALFSKQIAMIFNDEAEVISIIRNYLWIVPVSYGFLSIIMISGVSFNVMHKPFKSAFIGILRMMITYVPLAYLGSELYGLNGIFIAAAVSNLIVAIVSYFWLNRHIKYTLMPEYAAMSS